MLALLLLKFTATTTQGIQQSVHKTPTALWACTTNSLSSNLQCYEAAWHCKLCSVTSCNSLRWNYLRRYKKISVD